MKRKPPVPRFTQEKGEKKKFEPQNKEDKELVEMMERDIVCRNIEV